MPRPMAPTVSPPTATCAPDTRWMRAITRGGLGGNVWNQQYGEPRDRILEDQLALLEAPQLQLVLLGMFRQAGDHVVEVLVLDLQRRDARFDLLPFLFGQRLVAHRFPSSNCDKLHRPQDRLRPSYNIDK